EIMTGAVIPIDADTVVMYEDVDLDKGRAQLKKQPQKGQNIHLMGSDDTKGGLLVKAGTSIGAAEIGILATVGKSVVMVKKLPSVAVISTGNELIEIDQIPLPHQIRRSNAHTLKAALSVHGISADLHHLPDDQELIKKELGDLIQSKDVLLLSGGVSKGKFDFIPRVLAELKVDKEFHRVKQRPGKPFWFGRHVEYKTWIFSFPGNPVSTFINYHIYFNAWLRSSLGLPQRQLNVILQEELFIKGTLTRFIGVKTTWEEGKLLARTINTNSSGDLISLGAYDGFIRLDPRQLPYIPGEVVPYIPTRSY
ncbi:MAG: molybdopterin molybdotransferase MoeA, partial [Flavobacteriaceae bacterium]